MKIHKHYRLEKEMIDYIEEVKVEHNFSHSSQALKKIISDHMDKENTSIKVIKDELKDMLKKIILCVNKADKNSEVNTLLLNQLLLYSQVKTYADKLSPQLIHADKIVSDKIQSLRTKNLFDRDKENIKKQINFYSDDNNIDSEEFEFINPEDIL